MAGLHRNVFVRLRLQAALIAFLKVAAPTFVVLLMLAYLAGFIKLRR